MSNFPLELESAAFRFRDQYAWKKADLDAVYDYCLHSHVAITDGEAWCIRPIADCDPSDLIPGYDPKKINLRGAVKARTDSHIIYGIIPQRDGSMAVHEWGLARARAQTWSDYVGKSIEHTKTMVMKGNMEQDVVAEYSGSIYYNLSFMLEDGRSF